jgi:hypothetical protein
MSSFFSKTSLFSFAGGIPLGLAFYLPYELSQQKNTGNSLYDLYFKGEELNQKAKMFAQQEVELSINDVEFKAEAEKSIEMEESIQTIFKS